MRVLFADDLPDRARTRLASQGYDVVCDGTLSGEALTAALGSMEPQVLVVRSTRVTAADLAASPSLELVVRAGAGVNTIDVEEAAARGVFVSNCPGRNAAAVAELAVGLMVAVDRHIPDNVADLRAGRWNKRAWSQARGLSGRTFGVLGLGRIGEEVVRRVQAFDMSVLAWSRSLDAARAEALGVRACATPEDVAREADVLSVHLASAPGTRGLIGASILEAMRPGAILINTARADVVDEGELLRALDERGLRAGLDVFSGEPSAKEAPFTHPLAAHPRVVGTHHIGASTEQAQEAVGDEVCRVIEAFRASGQAPNCVNLERAPPPRAVLVVRHLDRVGVLAAVLDCLRRVELNVGEMQNTLFAGGKAASARIPLSEVPSPDALVEISAHVHVLGVSVVPPQSEVP